MNIFLRSFSLALFSFGEPWRQDSGWTDGCLGKRKYPDLQGHPSQPCGLQAGGHTRLQLSGFQLFDTPITRDVSCIHFLRLQSRSHANWVAQNSRNVFSHSPGSQMSKTKVSARWVPLRLHGESFLASSHFPRVPGSPWHPLACGSIPPVSPVQRMVFSLHLVIFTQSYCLWVCVPSPFLIRTMVTPDCGPWYSSITWS